MLSAHEVRYRAYDAAGTHVLEANPVIGLNPGVYRALARQDVNGLIQVGHADVFVRAPGVPAQPFVETWCYDDVFHCPRVTQTHNFVEYKQTWWEFTADLTTAPQNAVCPATSTDPTVKDNRADFNYQSL